MLYKAISTGLDIRISASATSGSSKISMAI
jgi:hypothetical protein